MQSTPPGEERHERAKQAHLGSAGVRCPPRQKSRVERLKAKVEPLLTEVTVDAWDVLFCGDTALGVQREQADDPLPGLNVPAAHGLHPAFALPVQ